MTRYHPTLSVVAGSGNVNLSNDTISIRTDMAITHQASSFMIEVDNRKAQYDASIGATISWGDPITITLDGTVILAGRIDEIDSGAVSKRKGNILALSGRDKFGALDDVVSSLQFSNTPSAIATAILSEYGFRKGSNDPAITMGTNKLPPNDDAGSSFIFNIVAHRKSLAKMLEEECALLAAPVTGWTGAAYDLWVTTAGTLNAVPCGYISSGITIPLNTETLKAVRKIDSYPVKNDWWLFGDNTSGAIPVSMSSGYPYTSPPDTWTEGNAADYSASSPSDILSIQNDSTIYVYPIDIGSRASIKVNFATKFTGGGSLTNASGYWFIQFPSAGTGIVWPAQYPGGLFNVNNETGGSTATGFTESQGAISAVNFWIRTNMVGQFLTMQMEVTDNAGNVADSPAQTYPYGNAPGTNRPANASDWEPLTFLFGAKANYTLKTGSLIDWTRISQVRFVVNGPKLSGLTVWFDGLSFTKPLVVNKNTGTSRRSYVVSDTAITNYKVGQTYLTAQMNNTSTPQTYWDFQGVGRADIPVGDTFTYGTTVILVREIRHTFSKRRGWQITMKGYEAT